MDNYIRYCMMGAPIKLKKGVIPHIFYCQPHRIKISNNFSRPAYNKLNRKREIVEILSDTENQNENNFPSTLQQPPHKIRKTENYRVLNTPDKTIFLDLTNSVSLYILFINTEIKDYLKSECITFNLQNNIVTSHVQPMQTTASSTMEIYSENSLLNPESIHSDSTNLVSLTTFN